MFLTRLKSEFLQCVACAATRIYHDLVSHDTVELPLEQLRISVLSVCSLRGELPIKGNTREDLLRWGRTRQFEGNTLIVRVHVEYIVSPSAFVEAQASQRNFQ